jgi:hypothetical protein
VLPLPRVEFAGPRRLPVARGQGYGCKLTADYTFALKRDFREPIKAVGFVGREQALNRLRSILGSRNAATVLVSGYRGVGKTALVDEAVDSQGGSARLVVRLSVPHFYSVPVDNLELRGQVLRALARATYFAIKDRKDIDKELAQLAEELYEKTYLRELNKSSVLATVAEATAQTAQTTRTETTFAPSKAFKVLLGSAAYAAISVAGTSAAWKISETSGAGYGLLAGIGIVGIAVVSGIGLSRTKEQQDTVHDAVTAKNEASNVGVFDLSPETLEFELRNLLSLLAKAKHSCVFVIDELDKLEIVDEAVRDAATQDDAAVSAADDDRIERDVIFRIVSSLKNFFTLGSGIFIFISGEEFYCRLLESIDAAEYSLAHTLFTDRIYLQSLHWSELEQLIDGLMKPAKENNAYRRIRNYLCWESRGHVFDLLSLLSEFVQYDDKGTPVFAARESGEQDRIWREGNLPDYWQTAAGLQKFVGAVFDESTRPSAREERFNQSLWLSLHRATRTLLDGDEIAWVEGTTYEVPEAPWLEALTEIDLEDIGGAIERLVVKMERHGAANLAVVSVAPQSVEATAIQSAPSRAAARGSSTPAEEVERLVRYTLVEQPPYPPSSVGSEAELIPFEESFLEINDWVQGIATNAGRIGIEFSEEVAKELRDLAGLASRVKETAARSIQPRHRVRSGIDRADRLGVRLINGSIDAALHAWIQSKQLNFTNELAAIDPRTGVAWAEGLAEFPTLAETLNSGAAGQFLLIGGTSENQMLVLVRPSDEQTQVVSAAYRQALTGEKGRDRRRQRLPIVQVTLAGSGRAPVVPQEVVGIISEDPASGLVAMLAAVFGGSRPTKKTIRTAEEDVAGWHVATVDPELRNLGELAKDLDRASFVAVE